MFFAVANASEDENVSLFGANWFRLTLNGSRSNTSHGAVGLAGHKSNKGTSEKRLQRRVRKRERLRGKARSCSRFPVGEAEKKLTFVSEVPGLQRKLKVAGKRDKNISYIHQCCALVIDRLRFAQWSPLTIWEKLSEVCGRVVLMQK